MRNRRSQFKRRKAPGSQRRVVIHTGDPYAGRYLFGSKQGVGQDTTGCTCGAGVPRHPPTEQERQRERGMKGYGTVRFRLWRTDDGELWEWR